MALDETTLRKAITDVLLRASNLPTMEDVADLLSKVREPAEIALAYSDEKWAREAERLLEPAVRVGAARIRRIPSKGWRRDRPQPLITVGGRLSHRLAFYGLPGDILQPVFLLAVAAAGEAWKPRGCAGLEGAKGKLVLYVVPGLPCVRALHHVLPVLLCSSEAELEAVNVETMLLQGMKPPVDRVPAFVTPSGRLVKGAPRSPGDAARLWES